MRRARSLLRSPYLLVGTLGLVLCVVSPVEAVDEATPEVAPEAQEPSAPTEPESETSPDDAEAEESAEQGDEDESDAPVARKRSPKPIEIEATAEGVVYWITITDVIDLGLAPHVERVVDLANEDPATVAIVSRIHTPGGRVDAAVRIRDALLDSRHPTLAFVDSEAISAGALIALAHDHIVMVPGGTIGAATPIQMGGGGEAQAVGEKTVSYVRGVFRATAEARDRDPLVAEAMVDADVNIPRLSPKGKLLTATSDEALDWGLADLKVEGEKDFLDRTGLAAPRIERMTVNWAEQLARVATHPMISGLLMTFGFLGLLMEFYSPGFGVIGGIGICCLLTFFFGHYVVHLAGMEEIAIFGLGVVLLLVELLVIPGFGFVGILGLAVITVALVMALVEVPVDLPVDVSFDFVDTTGIGDALFRVMISLMVTTALAMFAVTRLPRSSLFQRLVLADEVDGQAVGFGSDGASEAPDVGDEGTAVTELRPSGKVRLGTTVYDAITGGEHVERGVRIEVAGTRGSSLVVRAATEPESDAQVEPDDG